LSDGYENLPLEDAVASKASGVEVGSALVKKGIKRRIGSGQQEIAWSKVLLGQSAQCDSPHSSR